MEQILLHNISKSFQVHKRPEGRLGLLRGMFRRETECIRALENISFQINGGELVGYIGPNGAGKSTTVKVMSGILTPQAGECVIMGRTPWKERVGHVSQIGVVFGQRSQLWWDVPARDSFALLKDIYDIPAAAFQERLHELVSAMDIQPLLQTPVRQLSLGQRMRCEVAAALLHRPKILFLDEPTIGLDAVSKLALRDFLKHENRQSGVTMILTTHDMDDIEALCSRVMVIGRGNLLFDGGLDMLKQQFSPYRCIRAVTKIPADEMPIGGAVKTQVAGREWTVWFDPAATPAHSMVAQLAEQLPLADIMIERQNIDEIIAAMYREMKI
ncbi:MAG: ATP-binding cassette domain-containing protein [Oscillospiraceae bacterium]|nr:ATP-binding cassette domain-containing protein [Oscillospiraceae bacterium]